MVRRIFSRLILCSLLFVCLTAMMCDPDYQYKIDVSIDAELPAGVDSVKVCISYNDPEDGSVSKCLSSFSDFCSSGYLVFDDECPAEYTVQAKFYCAAGVTTSKTHTEPLDFFDDKNLVFWLYEERDLLKEEYSDYKLIQFMPPTDDACGKLVNYALMSVKR